MKEVISALRSERKSVARQLKKLDSVLSKLGSGGTITRRKRRASVAKSGATAKKGGSGGGRGKNKLGGSIHRQPRAQKEKDTAAQISAKKKAAQALLNEEE